MSRIRFIRRHLPSGGMWVGEFIPAHHFYFNDDEPVSHSVKVKKAIELIDTWNRSYTRDTWQYELHPDSPQPEAERVGRVGLLPEAERVGQMHTAVRKVLQHHGLTKHGDGVLEADLIAAVLGVAR